MVTYTTVVPPVESFVKGRTAHVACVRVTPNTDGRHAAAIVQQLLFCIVCKCFQFVVAVLVFSLLYFPFPESC